MFYHSEKISELYIYTRISVTTTIDPRTKPSVASRTGWFTSTPTTTFTIPSGTVSVTCLTVTVSPSPQSKDEENEKLHKLREYARDFRRQHTTDAEQFDWDSDDGDYGLAIGRLVVT
jgi:hypothetical protein